MKKSKPFNSQLLYSVFRIGLFIVCVYNLLSRTPMGQDSLCGAAYYGRCWEIRLLVACGANPSRVGWEDHFTPLGNAVRGGQLEAARVLIELGADPNVPNDRGWGETAIETQKFYSEIAPASRTRVVAFLRQHGER